MIDVYKVCGGLTSALFGTDSQNISILMLPRVVWSVTDMAVGHQYLKVKSLISDLI